MNGKEILILPRHSSADFVIQDSLKKITKGSSIVFLGMILGMLFGILGRIVIARWTTPEQYGIFTLGLGLVTIFSGLAALGLTEGAARYIAYYKGQRDIMKIREVIFSSVQISLISGFFAALALYAYSSFFAEKLLHNSQLSSHIKIFSLAITFIVLVNILVAICRGFGIVEARSYFDDILRNILFLGMVTIFLKTGKDFSSVIWSYTASFIISFTAIMFFIIKKKIIPKTADSIKNIGSTHSNFIKKKLMFYSMPILGISIIGIIYARADTLMLGYFKTTAVVGFYNAAYPMADLITVAMAAITFVLLPVLSELYAKKSMDEMKKVYTIVTKWVIIFSFPVFLFFFVFSKIILINLFGIKYAAADIPLQILVLATFFLILAGPTNIALQAVGKTKFMMWTAVIGLILNITLNFLLIPYLGMIGAAIAYFAGRLTIQAIQLFKLRRSLGLSPFDVRYLKTILISAIILLVFYVIFHKISISVLMLIPMSLLLIPIYGFILYKANGFCQEDITVIREIRDRIGAFFYPYFV